jgi:tetratricopeptide (TPR) repeat protein
MTTQRSKWFLAGLLCLVLWSTYASAQDRAWQSYIDAAVEAYVEGDYAEARKQFERAVKTAEAFGLEDPRLATSLNGLAETYRAQGHYAEAEPLYKRSLAIREKTLGPEHPDVATSLNNLAGIYKVQGHYAEAEPLYQRSLAIYEKALGPEHPDVATSLENYAYLLRATGRSADAVYMEVRAKAIRAKQE